MKKLILSLILIMTLPAVAGKMKEIYILTVESVTSTLGLTEDYIAIESTTIVEISGADLAVRTIVQDKFDTEKFDCITIFEKTQNSFQVIQTKCGIYK